MCTLMLVFQCVIALGIFNVWFIRPNIATSFRGGDAGSLADEFAAYGIPFGGMLLIGAIKVGAAIGLLAGIWHPHLILPSAVAMSVMMAGAVVMHAKVGDPLIRWMPAIAMLLMSLTVAFCA